MSDVARNIMPQSASLRAASERLNEGVGGLVLVVDDDGVLTGILTDGDFRRAVLGGGGLDDPLSLHMNRQFTSMPSGAAREEILRRLDGRIRHMPLVDDAGRPVELVSWNEIWRVSISEPTLGGNELKYVADCINTMWISSQGTYVTKFEQAVTDFVGASYGLTTANGTAALQLALHALDIGAGDEVLVPAITFGACGNAVIHNGATAVFVDIDEHTKTISPAAIEAAITPRTKAIMPVHLYGHPCDMDPIMEIAERHGLRVIEDCAEAIGAEYNGRRVGTFGDIGCFSFFANKVITTGEGGFVTTDDELLIKRMKRLRDHGMEPGRRYWHVEPGYNFRMTNLQAAVGLAQIERIDAFMEHRLGIAKVYAEELTGVRGIRLPFQANWAKHIYWLYCIEVDTNRDALIERMLKRGVETRYVFPPLHIQPAFGSQPENTLPVSERYAANGICLPVSAAMTNDDARRVATILGQELHAN